MCLDETGRVKHPAILWSDTRAEAEARSLLAEYTQKEWNTAYGGFIPVSAAYPSAKLRWIERHWPDALQGNAKVIQPKDFVNFRLTGVVAGDRWTTKGIVSLDPQQGARPLELLGLDPSLAPDCYNPVDIIGHVTSHASQATGIPEGVAVTAGWSDTLGAVLSVGLEVQDAFVLSGTSDSVGVITTVPVPSATTVLCASVWDTGYYIVYGPTSSGMSTIRWAESALQANLTSSSEAISMRSGRPWFLPFVLGQRSPVWNDNVRGAWINVDVHTTRQELGDAVMEGVVAAERSVLDAVIEETKITPRRIVLSGGGAKIPRLNAWRASLFPQPLFEADNEPVLGAALLAQWSAIGGSIQGLPRLRSTIDWRRVPSEVVQEDRYQGFKKASLMLVGNGLGSEGRTIDESISD